LLLKGEDGTSIEVEFSRDNKKRRATLNLEPYI
jgi:hypothetical protein